jgi:hypothetical protein
MLVLGAAFLFGFALTVASALRDATGGYRFRLRNDTAAPVEVYFVPYRGDGSVGPGVRLGEAGAGGASGWLEAPANPPGELVFAPRHTVQRVARLELGGTAARGVGNKDVPLVICLGETGLSVGDGRRSETNLPPPRPGWNLPLLYAAAAGWCGTFWYGRVSRRRFRDDR